MVQKRFGPSEGRSTRAEGRGKQRKQKIEKSEERKGKKERQREAEGRDGEEST